MILLAERKNTLPSGEEIQGMYAELFALRGKKDPEAVKQVASLKGRIGACRNALVKSIGVFPRTARSIAEQVLHTKILLWMDVREREQVPFSDVLMWERAYLFAKPNFHGLEMVDFCQALELDESNTAHKNTYEGVELPLWEIPWRKLILALRPVHHGKAHLYVSGEGLYDSLCRKVL